MTGWLVPSAGQKIPVQLRRYLLQQQKILLAENRFLQVRELKIHSKNPGSALRIWKPAAVISSGRESWHLAAKGPGNSVWGTLQVRRHASVVADTLLRVGHHPPYTYTRKFLQDLYPKKIVLGANWKTTTWFLQFFFGSQQQLLQ